MKTEASQFLPSRASGTDGPDYWDVALSQIHQLSGHASHRPRRFWLRLRNRFIPWFMWSY